MHAFAIFTKKKNIYPETIRPITFTAENTATRIDPWEGNKPIMVACDGRKKAGIKYDIMLKFPAMHQITNLLSLHMLRSIISLS